MGKDHVRYITEEAARFPFTDVHGNFLYTRRVIAEGHRVVQTADSESRSIMTCPDSAVFLFLRSTRTHTQELILVGSILPSP